MKEELTPYLDPGYGIDFQHPSIQDFAHQHTSGKDSELEKAVALYYAVRDGWRYNAYNISLEHSDIRASTIFPREEGHCIDKAILLTAALRAVYIPARLCLAKVRNHIAAEKMVAVFGTDELVPHGYVEIWLDDQWIKATPTFNRELCEHLGVEPLDFDGRSDALFQEFDQKGGSFMEYLEYYGSATDVPFDQIRDLLVSHYPKVFKNLHGRLDKDTMMRLSQSS